MDSFLVIQDIHNHNILGKVLCCIEHYFKNNMQGDFRKHIFAEVVWYAEHPNKLHYGRPLEIIWKIEFICDAPAFFNIILCMAFGTLQCVATLMVAFRLSW